MGVRRYICEPRCPWRSEVSNSPRVGVSSVYKQHMDVGNLAWVLCKSNIYS